MTGRRLQDFRYRRERAAVVAAAANVLYRVEP